MLIFYSLAFCSESLGLHVNLKVAEEMNITRGCLEHQDITGSAVHCLPS